MILVADSVELLTVSLMLVDSVVLTIESVALLTTVSVVFADEISPSDVVF